MDTESREIRFGVKAVKKGFVTPEQVVNALDIQVKEDLWKGKHRLIGKILLDQKIISVSQLNEVLDAMESESDSN